MKIQIFEKFCLFLFFNFLFPDFFLMINVQKYQRNNKLIESGLATVKSILHSGQS